jgi:anaerobic selenocysteine-containing dehydrogenase
LLIRAKKDIVRVKIATTDESEEMIVKTVCNMCTNHCGIDVHLENGKVAKVRGMAEHPFHRLCPKPAAYPELIYSEKRLTAPLKKVDGKFEKISWGDAFEIIADKLEQSKKSYGPESTVVFAGNGLALRSTPRVVRRFAEAYGTPNYITGGWTCFGARVMAFKLTLGTFPNPDYAEENRSMVLWGRDPSRSAVLERHQIDLSRKRGAKLIVVDPVVTAMAKRADIHAQLRPGTDCALALGLLHVIIGDQLYDKKFVAQWTVGFEKLAQSVKAYTPEKVEEITRVPAAIVRDMAQTYATLHPASISVGVSLDHSSSGIQAMRAIATLMAICGNLEVAGGNISYPKVPLKNLNLPDKVKNVSPIGTDFPLYTELRKQQSGTKLTDIMVTQDPYPIKSMLVVGGNPLVNWPNTNKVIKAFENLEFLLVVDMFMTDTAMLADIVLPAASDLETEDLRCAYFDHSGLPLIVKSNRVIEPVADCLEDWKIMAEIGRRMGYAKYFPWKTSDDLLEELLEPTDFTLAQLNQRPAGIIYSKKNQKNYLKDGFKTPSKKVEIFSETMARHGYDPVPTFHEPVESPASRPDLAEKYPFVFVAGSRVKGYTHSRFREIASLRKLHPEPVIEINSGAARNMGIDDGDRIRVESPHGCIQAAAKLSETILPEVVVLISGWSHHTGANANLLTNDNARDPVSGFPEYRALMCKIEKYADATVK